MADNTAALPQTPVKLGLSCAFVLVDHTRQDTKSEKGEL